MRISIIVTISRGFVFLQKEITTKCPVRKLKKSAEENVTYVNSIVWNLWSPILKLRCKYHWLFQSGSEELFS